MSVKKIGPRNWSVRVSWIDAEGKRHQPSKSGFKTKVAALEWEQDQLDRMQGLTHTASDNLSSVHQLHNEYVSRLERLGRSPKTIEFYNSSAGHWLPIIGDRRIKTIVPADIQDIVNRGVDSGYRPATVRGIYRAIRAEFRYAESLDEIGKTPCRGIELPADQAHPATICTPEDVQTLFSTLYDPPHPLYIPLVLAVMCALRRGEAIGLRWQDVDLATGEAQIRSNLVCVTGAQFQKVAKTRSSMDTVVLPESLLELLLELRETRKEQGLYKLGPTEVNGITPWSELDPREFISLSERNEVFRPGSMWERLRAVQTRHGLKLHGWHDLRHTYGTLMAEAGVDLVTISKAMRHSTTTITANMYVSNTTTIKRRATEQIGGIIQIGSPTANGHRKGSDR